MPKESEIRETIACYLSRELVIEVNREIGRQMATDGERRSFSNIVEEALRDWLDKRKK